MQPSSWIASLLISVLFFVSSCTAFHVPVFTTSRQPACHLCLAMKKGQRGGGQPSFAVSVDSSSSLETTTTSSAVVADIAMMDPANNELEEKEGDTAAYLEAPHARRWLPASLAEMNEAEYQQLLQKIINGLILTLSFGSAIYAILNVDAGMTRGWTQSEIAMRIPLDTWSSYEVALEEKPVVTKTIINVVIYLLGDWLSQTAFSKKNVLEFDALRTLRNGFIGLCFGPLVVYYYQFSDHILPLDGGLTNRIAKILMDQTIYLSVKCSMYIMAVGVLQGDSVATAAQNVKDKIKGIVFTAWKFWPLVHCITYSVIPAQHRILWVNMVDLVWNAILATISQKDAPVENGQEEEVDPATLALEADLTLLQDTLPPPVMPDSSASSDVVVGHNVMEPTPVYHFAAMATELNENFSSTISSSNSTLHNPLP